MRAELVVSRVFLMFVLLCASTSTWPLSKVNLNSAQLETSNIISSKRIYNIQDNGKSVVLIAGEATYPTADISLSNGANNNSPFVDAVLAITTTVRNHGPESATVSVENIVPPGYRNIGHINNDGLLSGNVVTWTDIHIEPGSSLQLQYRVTVNEALISMIQILHRIMMVVIKAKMMKIVQQFIRLN